MRTTRARDRAYAAELATFRAYAATTCPAALQQGAPTDPRKLGWAALVSLPYHPGESSMI
jgi:hypothetical protein